MPPVWWRRVSNGSDLPPRRYIPRLLPPQNSVNTWNKPLIQNQHNTFWIKDSALETKSTVKAAIFKPFFSWKSKSCSKVMPDSNCSNKLLKEQRGHVYTPKIIICPLEIPVWLHIKSRLDFKHKSTRLDFKHKSTNIWIMHNKVHTLSDRLTWTVIFPGSRWCLKAKYRIMFGCERFISDDASCSMLWTWNTIFSQDPCGLHLLLGKKRRKN